MKKTMRSFAMAEMPEYRGLKNKQKKWTKKLEIHQMIAITKYSKQMKDLEVT